MNNIFSIWIYKYGKFCASKEEYETRQKKRFDTMPK